MWSMLSIRSKKDGKVNPLKDLTICTVAFRSQFYLDLHWELTRQLNNPQDVDWKWIVVENTPAGESECLQDHERFKILPRIEPSENYAMHPAGYQHAAGLNEALSHVHSRYVLIVDPDFFIIRKNWIKDTLEHMQRNHLSFLGSPYHPKWYTKIRYVPVGYCLFIDLDQVNRKDLDFVVYDSSQKLISDNLKKTVPPFLRKTLSPLASRLRWLIFNRRMIEKEHDTGWHLYRKMKESDYKYECLVPVFRPQQNFTGKAYLAPTLNNFIERFLPDERSYIPKRAGYFSLTGFKERGYPDFNALEWEEYLWQDEPFGFHLRGYPKRDRDMRPEKEFLQDFMKNHFHASQSS